MLISSRRLKWFAIATLVTCALLLFPSTRAWIQRTSLARAVGQQWSAQDIVYHSKRCVVEARDLRWRDSAEARGVELVAQHGWFAFNDVALVDRTFLLPKVILQGVELRIRDAEPKQNFFVPSWKQQLATRISKFDWNLAREQMESLMFARELSAVWIQSIDRWVTRSQEIVAEVAHLEQEVVELDNPLRFEQTIQAKLSRLQELAREQSLLLQRFGSVEPRIDFESEEFQKLEEGDRAKLLIMVSGISDLESERASICQQVAIAAAQEVWLQLAHYAEVVDRLTLVNREQPLHDYDRNVRGTQEERLLFEVSELKASGILTHDLAETAFQAHGQLSQRLDATQEPHRQLDWQFQFQHKSTPIRVSATFDTQTSKATQVKLALAAASTSSSESDFISNSVGNSTSDLTSSWLRSTSNLSAGVADIGSRDALLTLNSTQGQLDGTLVLSSECQPFFTGESQRLLAEPANGSVPPSLRFHVGGHWGKVQLELMEATPDWLHGLIDKDLDRKWAELSEFANSQLTRELKELHANLQIQIEEAKLAGQAKVASAQRQLLATQASIQKRFAGITQTEFARRPGAIQR